MGTIGTFDGFTTARLAIYAAHKGLSVTGHNIANLNTEGYTRQVMDQVSLKVGANDMYRSQMDNHVGTGVLVTGINQIRDPYLDIRYRNTTSDVGYYDTKLSGLQEVADILDEIGKGENKGDGMLYAQLQKLADSLRELGKNPESGNDTLTRASAEALTLLFNTYAGKLQTLKENTENGFQQSVSAVNEILTNIRNLNTDIRRNEIFGDDALELRDERNRQIDALSEYMKINVTYSMEDIGAGQQVEKLTITLGNANPDDSITTDSTVLIDGIFGAQIEAPKQLPIQNPDFGNKDAAEDVRNALYLKEGGGVTNNIDEAEKKENPNYLINVTKMVDSKGREWEDNNTVWETVQGGTFSVPAVYSFPVTSNADWAENDTLKIGDKTFTVGKHISVDDVKDSEKLADFIAKNLTNSDYKITSQNGSLIFTAKKAGEVSQTGKGPDAPPEITTKDAEGKFTVGARSEDTKGVNGEPPNGATDSVTKNGDLTTTISYVESNKTWQKVTTYTKHTVPVELKDNDLYGKLQATREQLTEKGEFATQDDITMDPDALIKRGIPYYQMSLDLLARQVAKQYNELNQGYMTDQDGNYLDENNQTLELAGVPVNKTTGLTAEQKAALIADGCVVKDDNDNPIKDENGVEVPDLERWLKAKKVQVPNGAGVLFSNRNDGDNTENITASNISISHSWSSRQVKIVPTHVKLFPTGDKEKDESLKNSTQSENINHMISMMDAVLVYDPKDMDPLAMGKNLFEGSFNDMMSNTCTVLGNDQRVTNVKLINSYTTQVSIATTRDGVSGVDLNDEAMNMMTYQKAYSAACRLMTAMDEALDRLINNTGIAGR